MALQEHGPLALHKPVFVPFSGLRKAAQTFLTPGEHRGHRRKVFKIHSASDAHKIHPGIIK